MALTPGAFTTYDIDRSVVMFTMMNDTTPINCAISTSAMDGLEKSLQGVTDLKQVRAVCIK